MAAIATAMLAAVEELVQQPTRQEDVEPSAAESVTATTERPNQARKAVALALQHAGSGLVDATRTERDVKSATEVRHAGVMGSATFDILCLLSCGWGCATPHSQRSRELLMELHTSVGSFLLCAIMHLRWHWGARFWLARL